VYGPSPLLSKTRLSGPTAPVTFSNLAAWRLFFDPGMGTAEKKFCGLNEVKIMAKSARKVAEAIILEFMSGGKVEVVKSANEECSLFADLFETCVHEGAPWGSYGEKFNNAINNFIGYDDMIP
jgi:hypothetical protein